MTSASLTGTDPAAAAGARRRGTSSRPAADPALDESGLLHLVGYSATLAAVAARRRFAGQLAALDLRIVEFSILVLVDTNDEVNQKRLGATLDVSAPNLAVVLDRMVERGWVRRERSAIDRRAQLVRITPQGRALARRARRISLTAERELLAPLDAGERAQLIGLLHRVVRGAPRVEPPAPSLESR